MGSTAPERPAARFLVTAAEVDCANGFFAEEVGEGVPFRWMSAHSEIRFAPEATGRFLELWVRSHFHDLSQRLSARVLEDTPRSYELVRGWNAISIPVADGAEAVRLETNKIFPREYYPGDGRELALQVRQPLLHADPERHAHVQRQHANAVRNVRETLEGKALLESVPRTLGIDMHGACNVKPPCVYCEWDFNTALEAENVDAPFTLDTLSEFGRFFEDTSQLVNCSIGEPFMMRGFDDLLDEFGRRGKVLEITTNGQILTTRNIQKLLGRNIHLYISLDAATPETFAKLRNNMLPRIVENIRRLIEAKGGPGNMPLIYLVFMPMRANVHEAGAFVELCARLRVDRLVLRPLNDSEGVDLKWDRGGYHFDYQSELLPFPELVRVSGRVAALCEKLGVRLSDQMNFGGDLNAQFAAEFEAGRREALEHASGEPEAAAAVTVGPPDTQPEEASGTVQDDASSAVDAQPRAPLPSLGQDKLPACIEPWSSLYILRRGVMPCCYGGEPIAKMNEFEQAWNSPLLQGIRRELAAGRFHRYCFDSPDCPIVRKSDEARTLSLQQAMLLRVRRTWLRWERAEFGWPGRVYRRLPHLVRGGLRRVRARLGRWGDSTSRPNA